jgi:hypothetical protein
LGEKFTFIWLVLAISSTFYFNICQFLELGNFANILLGISQGLNLSTVVMKIDLVGEKTEVLQWD